MTAPRFIEQLPLGNDRTTRSAGPLLLGVSAQQKKVLLVWLTDSLLRRWRERGP
jgi:hypothetical protein